MRLYLYILAGWVVAAILIYALLCPWPLYSPYFGVLS